VGETGNKGGVDEEGDRTTGCGGRGVRGVIGRQKREMKVVGNKGREGREEIGEAKGWRERGMKRWIWNG